jgi:hypothetical protein
VPRQGRDRVTLRPARYLNLNERFNAPCTPGLLLSAVLVHLDDGTAGPCFRQNAGRDGVACLALRDGPTS